MIFNNKWAGVGTDTDTSKVEKISKKVWISEAKSLDTKMVSNLERKKASGDPYLVG